MASYRGEFAVNNPAFPAGSAAAIPTHAGDDLRPVAMDAPDIVYTAEDDKAIDDWVSDHVETTWHSLGTCAMKPREQGGVVDARLNVYGTQNLKCVDLSICPVSARLVRIVGPDGS